MFTDNRLLRFTAQVIFITVPLILVAFCGFLGNGGTVNYTFYAFAVLGGLWIAADSLSVKCYSNAFDVNEKSGMSICSYLFASGLFAEFINYCLSAYNLFSSSSYIAGIIVFVKFYTGICALLSSIYFVTVGITFSGRRYDFKYLKVMHLLPLLWVSGKMLELLVEAGVSSFDDVTSVTGFSVLAFAICFLFSFAREVENSGNTKRTTVMLAKELSFFSLLYFVSLIIQTSKSANDGMVSNILTAFTVITLCVFCFCFVHNIKVVSTNTEN